jgi:methyl-accepting chemotaxis protein
MDFDGAIQAHSNWKIRLLNSVRGRANEEIDLQLLRTDDHCSLGQWLHGEGRKFADDPKFAKLREAHTAFHNSAASLGLLIQQGQNASAEALLSAPDSEFNRLSFRIVAALMDLRHRHPIG